MRIAMLGFGNVGRALARLLIGKAEILRQEHDLTVRSGILTARTGWRLIRRMGRRCGWLRRAKS
jgi:homoserine dehydrogenase